jgi:CheY-like chemotaxis protein
MLVVDDASEAPFSLIALLKSAGVHNPTSIAESMEVARVFLQFATEGFGTVPEAIFIDVTVPQLRGMALCRWIRLLPGLEDVPIVLLCDRGDASRENVQSSEPTYYLEKFPSAAAFQEFLRTAENGRLKAMRAQSLATDALSTSATGPM